jgi:hypothetical protein
MGNWPYIELPLHDARTLPGTPPRPGAGQRVHVLLHLLRRQRHRERRALLVGHGAPRLLRPGPDLPRGRRVECRCRPSCRWSAALAFTQVPRPGGRGLLLLLLIRRRLWKRRRCRLGSRFRRPGLRLRRRRGRGRQMEAVCGVAEVAHELGTEIFYPAVTGQLLLHGAGVGADTSVRRGAGGAAPIARGASPGYCRAREGRRHAVGARRRRGRPRLEMVRRRGRRLRPRIRGRRHGPRVAAVRALRRGDATQRVKQRQRPPGAWRSRAGCGGRLAGGERRGGGAVEESEEGGPRQKETVVWSSASQRFCYGGKPGKQRRQAGITRPCGGRRGQFG